MNRGIIYRVHRALGNVLALLLLVWFASGAVMTFADFPRFTEVERLASAKALSRTQAIVVPPQLRQQLQRELARGERPRLVMLEGRASWLIAEGGAPRAWRSEPPFRVPMLDLARARAEVERRLGKHVRELERIDEPDQWSVGVIRAGALPFYRAWLDGADGEQVYLSAHTGELVQASTRTERALAWVGAIPHWIYPTLLRRERALWRNTVLLLSGLGMALTLSGMFAGVALLRTRRSKGIHKPIADRVLRWHHRLGLGFGALASSWLFSGALSLSPFDWPDASSPSAREQAALYGASLSGQAWPVRAALTQCQAELEVRELQLASLGESVYAVCLDAVGRSRIVDLRDPRLSVRRGLSQDQVTALAHHLTVGPEPVRSTTHRHYDSYYYPTHREPRRALPYLRLDLHDADETSLYVDPARASVELRSSRSSRLERWLFHGLHSLDLPGLYQQRVLWRTLVIALMLIGATVAGLGLTLSLRKLIRRQRRAPRTP